MSSDEWKKAIDAIAMGFPVKAYDDQFICIENPDYRHDNGSDPNILIDVADFKKARTLSPGQLDPYTIERAAEMVIANALKWDDAEDIAAAIRALAKGPDQK